MRDSDARAALVAALRRRVDGEVRFDTYTRQLYATDRGVSRRTIGNRIVRGSGELVGRWQQCGSSTATTIL